MGIDNPGATSTPTIVPVVRGRKGIRHVDSIQSPIDFSGERWNEYNTSPRSNKMSPSRSLSRSPGGSRLCGNGSEGRRRAVSFGSEDESHSDSNDPDGESDDGSENYDQQLNENGNFKFSGAGVLVAVGVVAFLLFIYFSKGDDQPEATWSADDLTKKFESLEQDFNQQNEDFWRNVRIAIQEVPVLNQPRSVIFLYEGKAQTTMNSILSKVSENALCYLTDCLNTAVTIDGSALNTTEVVNDYGLIISRYREKLERNGVMIVKNLERVPGISAQAFHSFCDDYSPLVHRALILFTIKVSKLPEGYPMQFLEQFLLNLWKDIGKDDKFYPLFTRISGTVLVVKPE